MKVLTEQEIADIQREAFLRGAKWWEYRSTNGTMWQSDQKEVYEEACRKYPGGTQQQVQADSPMSLDVAGDE